MVIVSICMTKTNRNGYECSKIFVGYVRIRIRTGYLEFESWFDRDTTGNFLPDSSLKSFLTALSMSCAVA